LLGVLGRVGQQVDEDLLEPRRVGVNGQSGWGREKAQGVMALFDPRRRGLDSPIVDLQPVPGRHNAIERLADDAVIGRLEDDRQE
jgi:hypothetical protein